MNKVNQDPVSSEASLEQKCRGIAESRGFILLKIKGSRGWPDRLLLRSGGRVTWIEFKKPGEVPRPLQVYHLEQLRQRGYRAVWVDNVKDFLYELDRNQT